MRMPVEPLFVDRHDAGRKLAKLLSKYMDRDDVVVLGLPRGGVPVALEVARRLGARLDVFLVRKLGVPGHRELAMGAIASGNVRVTNKDVIQSLGISQDAIDAVAEEEREELERREQMYRDGKDGLNLRNKTVVLVDDGLATGATMRAAILGVKAQHPKELIVAVPVAAPSTCENLEPLVDQIICVETPEDFRGVGAWYHEFGQTTDAEVQAALAQAAAELESG